ncbi:cytochrome c oxidase assembly protein [Microbacterium hydrocarbonoxydans]|uniref:cytochrome c oxidase assembly protein n=1 Tax=Microbacterium hydrocarbonoxydans TaxID=273678 RepID=UPI0030B80DAC
MWRTVSFLLGCVLLAAVTGLGVETYGQALVSVFMFQQLTLMMMVPPLLVLGSPGTLLLRATPHHGAGRLVLTAAHGALRSRPRNGYSVRGPLSRSTCSRSTASTLRVLPMPSSLSPGSRRTRGRIPPRRRALHHPILSSDPLPVRLGHGARALDVFAEAALHAFFGVFLMMASTILVGSFVAPTEALGIDPSPISS